MLRPGGLRGIYQVDLPLPVDGIERVALHTVMHRVSGRYYRIYADARRVERRPIFQIADDYFGTNFRQVLNFTLVG
jgi:hypothetical protein